MSNEQLHTEPATSGEPDSSKIIRYRMTNDYMFHMVLQENETALRYLLACLLGIDVHTIETVQLMNPITLGESIDEKTLVMDLKIKLNNNQILNLEMQTANQLDWPERSLYYIARAFTNLEKGQTYKDVLPCTQIGILDFSLFPEDTPEFYSQYYITNTKTHRIYSRKMGIRVLDLTQIDTGQAKNEYPELRHWAKLFKASTWEEAETLSKQSEGIHEAVVTFKKLSADDKIQLQCEAQERYERDMATAVINGKLEIAQTMISKGFSIADICDITGLTENDLDKLKK